MASEQHGMTQSPQDLDSQPAFASHRRTTSYEQTPYAPVNYGLPTSQYPSHARHGQDEYASQSMNPHRMSDGTLSRRPISDPNGIDFSQLSLTADSHPHPNLPRHQTAPILQNYPPQNLYTARQRAITADYANGDSNGAASVYSLDGGIGAYTAGNAGGEAYHQANSASGHDHYVAGGGFARQGDVPNPYYSAANDFLGLPPGVGQSSSSTQTIPMRQPVTTPLARSTTSGTNHSSDPASASSISLARKPTESVGASSTRRRGTQAAVDLNKPPYTKQYVDDYRKRMKDDPDPEAQFAFAKYLIEAAKKIGDELSQSDPRLGRRYRDVLLQESLRNIKKLAEGKEPYPEAQFFLANLYGTGHLGLQVDHEKAYYLYVMASKLNHPAATYRSAVCNEIGAGTKKDPNRAVLFYRKAAALGDTAGMYKLSMVLLGGLLSTPRNPREAIVWLRRAASQADEDNPHALHELALLHERPNNGGVVPQDPNIARDLFSQAAAIGYAPAQFKLGAAHEFGTLGCPIDPRRSIAWYTKAAEKGDSEAELALSGWYLTGSGQCLGSMWDSIAYATAEGVLKQSDTEAYLWGRKAANKGLAKAEYAVGCTSLPLVQLLFALTEVSDYTEIGIGIKQDLESAKRWYMRAAGWSPLAIRLFEKLMERLAQQHKRAMQRLTELNNAKNAKSKRSQARPTRHEAQNECVIM